MYRSTAKGYFSGYGGMEFGIMQAGVNMIQSLDLDIEAINCMQMNKNYFSHTVINGDIKDKTALDQPRIEIIIGNLSLCEILGNSGYSWNENWRRFISTFFPAYCY